MMSFIMIILLINFFNLSSHFFILTFKYINLVIFIYHHILQFFNHFFFLFQFFLCFFDHLCEIKVDIYVSFFTNPKNPILNWGGIKRRGRSWYLYIFSWSEQLHGIYIIFLFHFYKIEYNIFQIHQWINSPQIYPIILHQLITLCFNYCLYWWFRFDY